MGAPQRARRLRYRRFVEEGLVREIANPLAAAQWQVVLGGESFLQRLKDHLNSPQEQEDELPALRQLRRRPEVQSILDAVARSYRCSRAQLLQRGKKDNEARAVAMVLVWDCCGMSLREIGELFGGAAYTAVAQMIARTREKDRKRALTFKLAKLAAKCGK
jgi:chromosomal replication initiation ATPase DnaA